MYISAVSAKQNKRCLFVWTEVGGFYKTCHRHERQAHFPPAVNCFQDSGGDNRLNGPKCKNRRALYSVN